MNYDKAKARPNANINISDNVADRYASSGLSYFLDRIHQQPKLASSHQELIYESNYLIAEAKKLMSNCKITSSPQELIDDSKRLIAHAEKIINNCKAMHR